MIEYNKKIISCSRIYVTVVYTPHVVNLNTFSLSDVQLEITLICNIKHSFK